MEQDLFDTLLDALLGANIVYHADTLEAVSKLVKAYPEQMEIYNSKLPDEDDFEVDINPLKLQLMTTRIYKNLKKIIDNE